MNLGIVGSIVPGTCLCVPTPPGPFPATGVLLSGTPQFLDNGAPVGHVGSMVMFPCGTSTVISGSVMELVNGFPVAMTGSSVTGCGIGTLIGQSTDLVN